MNPKLSTEALREKFEQSADKEADDAGFDDLRESRRWREPPEKALRRENIVIKSSTMTDQRSQEAVKLLGDALQTCGIENEIASFLKTKFDELHGSHWQCIVGRNFGSHLDTVEHVQMNISKISVILFRCH